MKYHVRRIHEVEKMGATIVCAQNASGADPLRALDVYGEQVLPALRGRLPPGVGRRLVGADGEQSKGALR